jgi:hypothetical protein
VGTARTGGRYAFQWLSLLALLLCAQPQPAAAQANEVIVNPQGSTKTPKTATARKPPPGAPHFQLEARISLSQGYIKEAAWLSNDAFITLAIRPDGAQVLAFDYETLRREKFLSSDFVQKYLSGTTQADRLGWTISPARKYLFFTWFTDDSKRHWRLVDISSPPNFKLRSFTPPEGMEIDRALFSPDDRYVALFHDSHREGSPVSVLVLDLQQGAEVWRVPSAEVGFVKDAWWEGAIYDAPKFQATAMVHKGEFLKRPALVSADVAAKQLTFTENEDGVITGSSGLWGQVLALQSKPGARAPYFLLISQREDRDTMALTSIPDRIELLSEPGLILLANNDKQAGVSELWLIDTNKGSKYLVDGDCAGFALNAQGRLLVRAERSNELRIYEFVNPRKKDDAANDDPDSQYKWIPH